MTARDRGDDVTETRQETAAEYLRAAADAIRCHTGISTCRQWVGKEYGVYAVFDDATDTTDLTISADVGLALGAFLDRQAHQAEWWDMHPPHDDVFALAAAVLGRCWRSGRA